MPALFNDPTFESILQLYVFVLGSVIGSFLNVCIYRLPLEKSIVKPRSRCPHCDAIIPWYYNIPIVSYLWLRGRCAKCKERISPVYPFVEVLTGSLFVLVYYYFGLSIASLIYLYFGCSIIILIFIDYFHKLLPAAITYPGIILGLAASFVNPFVGPLDSLYGVLLGGFLPTFTYFVHKWVRKKEGLGHGDIFMMMMVGAFLGWRQVFVVLILSALLGSIVGIAIILIFKKGGDYMLPFGTFIGAVALPAIFWGEEVWFRFMRI